MGFCMIDRKIFFETIRGWLFTGNLRMGQVSGMSAIFDGWDHASGESDAQLAYILATVYRETAQTMQPIEEYGRGKGHSYGMATGAYGQVYYGRGFVQLTWDYNYSNADKKLHDIGFLTPSEDLLKTPELALRPDIAAQILIHGMIDGWFTGKKLSNYFSGRGSDWVGARHIINGSDHAEEIAGNANTFYTAIKAASLPTPSLEPTHPLPTTQLPTQPKETEMTTVTTVTTAPAVAAPSFSMSYLTGGLSVLMGLVHGFGLTGLPTWAALLAGGAHVIIGLAIYAFKRTAKRTEARDYEKMLLTKALGDNIASFAIAVQDKAIDYAQTYTGQTEDSAAQKSAGQIMDALLAAKAHPDFNSILAAVGYVKAAVMAPNQTASYSQIGLQAAMVAAQTPYAAT